MKSFYLSLVLFPVVISSYGQGSPGDVNQFIDVWHMAATKADAKTFFDSMAEGAIYIGTDATERWTKSEFVTFANRTLIGAKHGISNLATGTFM
jgi:hypothetical protein